MKDIHAHEGDHMMLKPKVAVLSRESLAEAIVERFVRRPVPCLLGRRHGRPRGDRLPGQARQVRAARQYILEHQQQDLQPLNNPEPKCTAFAGRNWLRGVKYFLPFLNAVLSLDY